MWKWEAEGQPKAVVVIVHNAYEHHRRYAWLIQKLRSNHFHVVMGDLPGHGNTGRHSAHDKSFTTYIAYVKRLLNVALTDSLPLFIIGHGLGATITMRILQTEKIVCAGAILSSPWLSLKHQPSKLSSIFTKLSSSMKINHDIHIELLTRNVDHYLEFKDDTDYNCIVTAGWYRELQQFMKAVFSEDRTIDNVPVLMHLAQDDQIIHHTHARDWLVRQSLTEFQYKEWPAAYHDIYQENEREEVYLYIESFMHAQLRSLGYIV